MAKANLTKSANIDTTAREVDFVARFSRNWDHLRDIMGIMRLIQKAPNSVLKSKYAEVTLASSVGEGESVPYSLAEVKTKDYATITLEKYKKAVSIEAINEHGYDDAVGMTDDQFLFELQSNVLGRFYSYLNGGTLITAKSTFQAALAEAQGQVRNKWDAMERGITEVVGFCNMLDAYDYLGAANITVQSEFGMNYIENFLGYSRLFLCNANLVPRNKVIATPVENIILYYVNPEEGDFARAGLNFTVDGDTPLIGFHVEANYDTVVTEALAIMGMTLMAEYLDGIAVVDIGTATFTAVETPTKANIGTYFEKAADNTYFKTTDTDVVSGKTYYTRTVTQGA